tara:strand:- start:11168 stop:11926 length:759 start_codon:yes stop_codon:yes gene_type:complete
MKDNIAILPIRSKSKRLVNKNFINIYGIPLFLITVCYVMASKKFDKLIIATDEPKRVSKYLKNYDNIIVYKRKEENSTDNSSSEDVMSEVIQELSLDENTWITLFQATNPFHKNKYFLELENIILTDRFNSIYTVVNSHRFTSKEVSKLDFIRERTQDKSATLLETGLFWSIKVKAFLEKSSRIQNPSTTIQIDKYDDSDIDEKIDYDFLKNNIQQRLYGDKLLIREIYKINKLLFIKLFLIRILKSIITRD